MLGADGDAVGIVLPDAAVQEVVARAVRRTDVPRTRIRSDAHRVHQPERAAERPHVLRDAAAQQEHVGARRLAHQFQTVAVRFDRRLVRIVQLRLADLIVLVAIVDVHLSRRRAGPQTVHLEEAIAPLVRNPLHDTPQVLPRPGLGHVQARAAPGRLEGLAVVVRGEPVLVVLEERIVMSAGEGHEPDAGRQAAVCVISAGDRLHAAGIRTGGAMRREVAARAVGRDAVLPAVVDLHELEAERLQVFGGERGQFREVLFVAAHRRTCPRTRCSSRPAAAAT